MRRLGHEAYSCDIEPCSGGHPEWHIQQDVIPVLNGKCSFETADGRLHDINGRWDMIIAFPPCTYLTSAGTRHYSLKCNSAEKVAERIRKREEAAGFFMAFAEADCRRIAVENPVGYMNTHWRKPDQIIHPYFFGDNAKKRTCLWLKGLPRLEPTDMLPEPQPVYICQGEKCRGKKIGWCEGMRGIKGGQKERAKARSKTFAGIAKGHGRTVGRKSMRCRKRVTFFPVKMIFCRFTVKSHTVMESLESRHGMKQIAGWYYQNRFEGCGRVMPKSA